ncbi:protein kinase domain-containing protein [Streptomyces sp. SAJ15]|uniref:serine/threonine-protein kinase n=1 Tax=Streptomyces sp. SAJ15 TaxID=2011095 RepID=UPI0011846AB2|nr:serine/threonine-protein kinase [Streptomyces sp. SAJ15]TVL91075.1 hypothetical protein CD790_17415 [Streptomyces sp. SAJ15]
MSSVLPLLPDDPDRVGAYRLVGRLGSGGMGTVFLAHTAGGRLVAVKTVRADLREQTGFRVRLSLEAEAVRALGAAHTAEFLGVDAEAAVPWLATGYIIGPSLAEAVRAVGPLPRAPVRRLGAALAETLATLHRAGLVHRDLKPANVLVTPRGPKVIDFGLARAPGSPALTASGAISGTPSYMSPEQARGAEHGPEGDVFALGAVLVFAASGHGPYDGPGRDALRLLREGAPPDLTGVPDGLRDTLAACLSAEPGDRPALARLQADWGPFDPAEFAGLLPDPLLADIGGRVEEIAALDGAPPREPSPSSSGAPSRRAVLVGSATAALAVGGLSALWATGALPGTGDEGSASPKPGRSVARRPPGVAPEPLWSVPGTLGTTPPLATDRTVLHRGETNRALDPATGREIWEASSTALDPAVSAGRLVALFFDDEGAPAAGYLDPRTGRLAPGSAGRRVLGELSRYSRVLAADARALYLLGYYDSDVDRTEPWLLAYDLPARRLRWRHRVEGAYTDDGIAAAVSRGRLFCSDAARLFAVDTADGGLLWARQVRSDREAASVSDRGGTYPPVVGDRHAYDYARVITAVDLRTGRVAWTLEPEDSLTMFSSPVCVDGTLFTAAKSFRAYDQSTGRRLWSYDPGPHFTDLALPRPFRGELYAGVSGGGQAVTAVSIAKRRTVWSLSARSVRMPHGPNTMTHHDNRLYLQTYDRIAAVPLD